MFNLHKFRYHYRMHKLIGSGLFILIWVTGICQEAEDNYWRTYQNEIYTQFQFSSDTSTIESWEYQEFSASEALQSKTFDTEEKITINLIFHLMYSEDTSNTLESLTYQIDALNRDFNGMNWPEKDPSDPNNLYRPLAASPNIEFVLSEHKSEGGELSGIVQLSEVTTWEKFDEMKSKENGSPPVEPEKQINIWVVKMDEGLSSYASHPFSSKDIDGIVLDYRLFGKGEFEKYNEGKTLTHLIGNYLGLYDLWGLAYCRDDGIDDTPIHNTPTRGNPGNKYHSMCPGFPKSMTSNLMDNSNDDSMYFFTKGQVQRMRYMLSPEGPRYHLLAN